MAIPGTMPDMNLLLSLVLLPGPGGFVAPVEPPAVTRRFDPPAHRWLPGHRGVDLAAPASVPIRAAGAGTVVFAGTIAGRGVVSVAHAGGLRTTYEPLTLGSVRVGETVAAGQRIGTLTPGHAGCPGPACLHWGLRRGRDYLDPLALLGAGRVRLLPVVAQ
ncbi:M23 family metallopeptidase [Actinoplanes sp. NPDC051494]|uniref:M23 family metallopeptidase n=1 Tax=Actinoplanes sp. NPDC051494 TaxID=3363907 RepID=UPI00379B0FAA